MKYEVLIKKSTVVLLTGLMLLTVSSCGVGARIDDRPAAYTALSVDQKKLVRDHKISNGMSEDAVYFAWDEPAIKLITQMNGQNAEVWRYRDPYGGAECFVVFQQGKVVTWYLSPEEI
jgi:hypothetical protein